MPDVASAMGYIRALGRDTRANGWDLAKAAGHEKPYRIQALLSRLKWRWEAVRAALPQLAQEVLRDDPGDEIGPGSRSTRPLTCAKVIRPHAWRRSTPGLPGKSRIA